MQDHPEIRFSPVLSAVDPRSLPARLPAGTTPFVPLKPGGAASRRWLRSVDPAPWGHFCLSDLTLQAMARRDPLGLQEARAAGVQGIVAMDTPLYGFMTPGQRQRAHAFHLHRTLRTLDRAPLLGLGVVPLVKALTIADLDQQLDFLRELGVHRAALYARELLLEHNETLVRRFVRGAHRRGIRPLLRGAFSRRAVQWGAADLAAQHHYVLARKGRRMATRGGTRPVGGGFFSCATGRFVRPGDVQALCSHNYHLARRRLQFRTCRLPVGA